MTGAEGALGQVVARRFVDAGCRVIGSFHPSRKGSLPNLSGVEWREVDLGNAASVRGAVAAMGEVDALVHCAGGFRYATLDQLKDEDLDFLVSANFRSAVYLLRELLPGMKQRGFGRIALVSARATLQATAGMGAYAASKAGLNMLVSSVADEVRKLDININAVMPTVIDTPANRKDMPGANPDAWVKPEELAEILFSLTQPWGKPIHGALIPVAGRL